jgi:HAD superfamily hydrolase (TIGR01549 family)
VLSQSQPRLGLVFDLDDTLVAGTAAMNRAIRECCGAVGIESSALLHAHANVWSLVESGNLSIPAYRIRRWMECGLNKAQAVAIEERFFNRFCDVRLRLGARRVVETLRARGYAIGILTDGPDDTQRAKLERVRLADLIDAMAVWDETGLRKPDPRAFIGIASTLGSLPQDTVMIGNSYNLDAIGALRAGYRHAIWLTSSRRREVDPRISRVRRLEEIPAILRSIEAQSAKA